MRVSDWGSQEGSAGSLCSAAAVLLRFSCSYPAVEAMGGESFESVLSSSSEKTSCQPRLLYALLEWIPVPCEGEVGA